MINIDVIEKVNAQFRLLISQIEDKKAEIERLREALKAAQDQFQFYADEHRSAGKTEKAQTNQAMADRCDAALQPKENTQ